jgi:hypothetical protein
MTCFASYKDTALTPPYQGSSHPTGFGYFPSANTKALVEGALEYLPYALSRVLQGKYL